MCYLIQVKLPVRLVSKENQSNMKQQTIMYLLILITLVTGFRPDKSEIDGAWRRTDASGAAILLTIADNYLMQTTYASDRFVATRGGAWQRSGDKLQLTVEFDTQDSSLVGQVETYTLTTQKGQLTLTGPAGKQTLSRVEEPAQTALAGLWRITGRANESGQVTTMQRGARKTIKLLTGSRFQWAAINPQTKQFMGTGGGTYRMDGDQYTETIDFFSRDNSRVGRSLTFTAKITGSDWQHTGKSSTGGPVNEVWSREQ